MNLWINLVLFQLGWVATVWGAGAGYWWAALMALAVLAAVTFRLSPWPRTDFALMCAACLIGLVIDSAWVQLGLLSFAEPMPFPALAPIWILAMWMSFALTLNHSMGFFKERLLLAGLFGLVGGPLAYWIAGSRFDAVDLTAEPWIVYGTLGVAWAVVTPLLLAMASNWLPKLDPAPASRA
jgi:hypothetical protein